MTPRPRKHPWNHLRPIAASLLLMGLITIGAGWGILRLMQASRAVAAAREDLATCQTIAQRMQTLRAAPSIAATSAIEPREIAALVEAAANDVGLPAGTVNRISPNPPRQVRGTLYQELTTDLQVSRVTLQQVVTMLDTLRRRDTGLSIESLRLSAPRNDEDAQHWRLEASVRYLIFAPESD